MRTMLLNRITRWVTARARRAAVPDAGNPGALGPAQTKRLLIRLHDLEWQVRGLTEQCSALQQTVSVHDWGLEALWEQVQEPRTPSTPAGPPAPEPTKKRTLN